MRQGFKYKCELMKHNSRPTLIVQDPPLVQLPIGSNDSGYIRHPDDPKHVYNKHHGLIIRAIQARQYLALAYHTWMFGERRERFDDFVQLMEATLEGGVKIVPFVEALPERYRPP